MFLHNPCCEWYLYIFQVHQVILWRKRCVYWRFQYTTRYKCRCDEQSTTRPLSLSDLQASLVRLQVCLRLCMPPVVKLSQSSNNYRWQKVLYTTSQRWLGLFFCLRRGSALSLTVCYGDQLQYSRSHGPGSWYVDK